MLQLRFAALLVVLGGAACIRTETFGADPPAAKPNDAPQAASPKEEAVQADYRAKRKQVTRDMQDIVAALLNYLQVHGRFPPSSVVGPNGETRHSWRVAILPYLGHQELYDQYNLDEEWDSAQNEKVLAKMPAVFRSPFDKDDSIYSSYFGLVGEQAMFGKPEGTNLNADLPDRTERTILIIEARRQIPWTRPEDLAYDAEKPLPEFGGWDPPEVAGKFSAALCDSAVMTMSVPTDEARLRQMIHRDDGKP